MYKNSDDEISGKKKPNCKENKRKFSHTFF